MCFVSYSVLPIHQRCSDHLEGEGVWLTMWQQHHPRTAIFADDTALLAHDEDSLRKSLNYLVEWCEEWGVGINVSKCGIMHMRKKGVVRSKMSYSIGGEDLPFVSNYKYLGCTVDEHLDLDDMVKDKGVDGKKALGAWFQRGNVEMGGVEV